MTRSTSEWWVLNATFRDGDRSALDITNAEAIRWTISAEQGGTAFLEATLGNGRAVIVNGPTGRADITIETADHADIVAGTYYHECVVTLDGGEVTAQFHGTLTVEAATP